MKYNGTELNEFTSDRPVVFDPPKKMLVWDDSSIRPQLETVLAYIPGCRYRAAAKGASWEYCAEIPEELPEEPKSRRATYLELAKWLAQGNGLFTNKSACYAWAYGEVDRRSENDACPHSVLVRKWDDKEWHEPTADYMGLEG